MDTNNNDNNTMEEETTDIIIETPFPKKPNKPRKSCLFQRNWPY
jgi:hypothetical protein